MPGGILNLVSEGQPNVILNSNPSKTFFKCTYKKYTNFGLQKFRVDYEGQKTMSLTDYTEYIFKIPRYGDLLLDTYAVVNLPDIWSPIIPPRVIDPSVNNWAPYEFKWIHNIGAKMIHRIQITCGSQLLNEYSGDYLLAMAQRDFTCDQMDKFNIMIGEIPELNSPENAKSRNNVYPNAFWNNDQAIEPSIPSQNIYIPLNAWFCLNSQQAFPLTALQYNELTIKIIFRPICELFQIRDVTDYTNNYPYVAPNFNNDYMQFYRFTQPPPDVVLTSSSYTDVRNHWDTSAIYLMCTYGFLSDDERMLFAQNEQKYLFKKIHETIFYNIAGQTRIDIKSLGMVASHLFYFQRSDVNLRNEWSNYTNWPYDYVPINVGPAQTEGSYTVTYPDSNGDPTTITLYGPGVNLDNSLTGYYVTPIEDPQNIRDILVSMGILFDGGYRENTLPEGVYNYIEKYLRTSGKAPVGLYVYNYGLNADYAALQPSGAINMSRFSIIEFEIVTINPPLDPYAQAIPVCDPISFTFTGINKPSWKVYIYSYDLHLFEERYNMVSFISGNCGLLWAS